MLTQPVTYDKNGNIQTLYRTGHTNANYTTFGAMDQLTYAYDNGNQLQSVGDGAAGTGFTDNNAGGLDYDYDTNGNMTQDLNKGIQAQGIAYNHLNLPTNIVVSGIENGTIDYIYDATGVKLRKNVLKNGVITPTDYAGNYVYKNNSLEFSSTAEGYIEPKNANNYSQGFNYVYQYKDHLGNIRLSYKDVNEDGDINVTNDPMTTEIVEENNYYPFGLKHKGYNSVVNSTNVGQNFRYNGIELEESLGLNLYEMEFRQNDPAIGRWVGVDPVVHYSKSPYNAFDNNPAYWADPSGADSWTYIDGSYLNNVTGETTDDWRRAVDETKENKNSKGEKSKNGEESILSEDFTFQSYPGQIDFTNTYSTEEKEKFLKEVIDWFGHVNKYGGDIHPGSIIDFHADLKPENEKYQDNLLIRIFRGVFGYENGPEVDIRVGDNVVKIGYLDDVQKNADKYGATHVNFVGEATYVDGKNTHAYKISIKTSGGFNNGADIIYMNFRGVDRKLYNEIRKRIEAYEPYKAKFIPYKKQ